MNHTIKELKKHIFDYLLLFSGGVIFLIGLQLFKGESLIQFLILLLFVTFYMLWAMYHHVMDDSIRLRTMVEYILIGFTILFLVKMIIL